MRRAALVGACAAGLVSLAVLSLGLIRGTRTRYCPWKHWMSDTASCRILDRSGDRILIRHFDLDTNELEFEIRDGGGSRWYEVPEPYWPGKPLADGVRLSPVGGARVQASGRVVDLREKT